MRGAWLLNLGKRIVEGSILISEGIGFIFSRLKPNQKKINIQGITFENADHILWSLVADIFVNREYSPPGFEIRQNDIVVDIGGHQGVFTAFASSYTKNKILVFEPFPENFSKLGKLAERHNWKNVEMRNLAVGPENGEIELYVGKTMSRNSIRGKDVLTGEKLTHSFTVPSISLGSIVADLPVVDLLKMDCEGAEFPILLNCEDSTLKKIRKIVLEYHSEKGSLELDELISVLGKHYSQVAVKHLPNVPLGYLYAR